MEVGQRDAYSLLGSGSHPLNHQSVQCVGRQMVGSSTPRAPIRVLVADDQRLFANMLEAILASDQRPRPSVETFTGLKTVVVNVG